MESSQPFHLYISTKKKNCFIADIAYVCYCRKGCQIKKKKKKKKVQILMRPSLYGQYLARSKCETTLLPFPYLKGHFSAFKSFIDAVSHVNKCVIILVAIEILIVIIRQHRLAKVILLNTQNICLYVQIKTYFFTVLEFIRQPI